MGFLSKLFGGGRPSRPSAIDQSVLVDREAVWVFLQCAKCGERISLRIRKSTEIQREYDETAGYAFFVNKVVIGNKCYNRIPVRIEFDTSYTPINKQIEGGRFVSADEFKTQGRG